MSSKLTNAGRANLLFLLVDRVRWLRRHLREAMADEDLPEMTPTHLMVFGYLEPGGTSISELARRTGVSRQAMHQTVRELAQAGLVEVASGPAVGRAKSVRLTRTGRRIDARAVALVHDFEVGLGRRLGKGEVAALRRALEADWG